ncbi:MAG: hypothetical protein GY833_06645 [Aestuariibacter sp.]|nr:hypothetical protein [Aestuariibacter sp.]
MFPKVLEKFLVYLLLAAFLEVASFQAIRSNLSFALPHIQIDCIGQIIGDTEIVTNQSIDVNQDGKPDQVVLYGKDHLYVLVALSQSQTHCEVILNEHLTALILVNPSAWRTVAVHKIEMIELTGDDKPEIYIWLEKSGEGVGPRYEYAVHAIYTFVDGNLQQALNVELCLAFNSFEFRETATGNAKDVYLDGDSLCNPPWSSGRTYSIMRWNGEKFALVESGTIDIATTDPPWLNVCCIVAPISFLVVTLMLVTRLRKVTAN